MQRDSELERSVSFGRNVLSSPASSSVEGLFGRNDSDVQSEVPSASLVATDPDLKHTELDTGSHVSANINFEHAVSTAWNSLQSSTTEPIWNTGFWKCIFGNDSLGDVVTQQFKRPAPVQSLEEETGDEDKRARTMPVALQSGPLFQLCVKSTDDVSWQEKREAQLQKALKHWLILIGSWRSEIEFVTCVGGCENTNAQLIMLGDVFRGKAPSTLTQRANSMKVLCSMLEQEGLQFPCSENELYGILCELRRQGAPPSRGKGILEAVAFKLVL